jgi:hypothetical protein
MPTEAGVAVESLHSTCSLGREEEGAAEAEAEEELEAGRGGEMRHWKRRARGREPMISAAESAHSSGVILERSAPLCMWLT